MIVFLSSSILFLVIPCALTMTTTTITSTAWALPLPSKIKSTGGPLTNNSSIPQAATYSNSTYGVNMTYPSDWQVIDNITLPSNRTTQVALFQSPQGPNLSVSIDSFNGSETPNSYLAEIIESYRGDYQNFTLIKTDTFYNPMLGYNPAYDIYYAWVDHSGNLQLSKEIGTIIGNKTYYTTYTATTRDFSNFESIADQMAHSLIINTNQTGISTNIGRLIQCPDVSCEF